MSDIIARGMAGKALKEIADIEVGGVSFSDVTPNADSSTGSAGISTDVSRGDHTHPTDTTRASAEELASLSEIVTDHGNSIEGLDEDITHLQEDIEEIQDTSIPAARDGLANLPILQFSTASDGDPTIELSYEYYDKESGEMIDGLSPLKLDQTEFEIQNNHLHIKDIYQDKLVSGTNIKTINNQSILGSGNIPLSGGGEPDAYIKSASVDGNTLTLTNKDDSTVEFTTLSETQVNSLIDAKLEVVENGTY